MNIKSLSKVQSDIVNFITNNNLPGSTDSAKFIKIHDTEDMYLTDISFSHDTTLDKRVDVNVYNKIRKSDNDGVILKPDRQIDITIDSHECDLIRAKLDVFEFLVSIDSSDIDNSCGDKYVYFINIPEIDGLVDIELRNHNNPFMRIRTTKRHFLAPCSIHVANVMDGTSNE